MAYLDIDLNLTAMSKMSNAELNVVLSALNSVRPSTPAESKKTPCSADTTSTATETSCVAQEESGKIVYPTECVCCPCCKCDCALASSKISTDSVKTTIHELITLLEVPRDVPVVEAPEYTRKILSQEKIWPILSMFAIEGVSVLQKMYADVNSRKYARDILRELVYQISRNAPGFMMRSKRIVDSTRFKFPPLLKQLHDSCFIVGEKSLLATAIELGELQDIDLILRCQGLNATL